ncbi:WD40-repeat-containing domain protein, partial [Lineolata rhizophorae]
MLAEHLVAAISARSAPSPTPTKDGGIFLYEFQPVVTQKAIFKKSAAPPNCVAVNDSHIFAGQVDKAVVHVYNREKGNQEAIIPFPERITCLTLAALGTLLVLGTQGGRLILWEVITSPSHLQAVTAVAVDPTSNFAFTVSTDTYIHIWSLPRLLAFNATPESLSPTNTISAHRSSISALTVGHSTTAACFAISSDDGGTVQVWDIRTGNILKSYLTAEASRVTSLAVDPADRGFYIGFEDGSVQMVHFFSQTVKPSIAELSSGAELTRDPSHLRATNTPVALQQISRWIPEVGNQTGPVLSLALSWDGTMLLSGHTDGRIIAWDIGSSRYESTIATLPGPVSNLMILHP